MNATHSIPRKAGFTLMEVNLAIFIMAAGVLAMVSLYPLGYRENQQSKDDVKAAAAADAVLNQIRGALSARSLSWDDWKSAVQGAVRVTGQGERSGGWAAYCETGSGFTPKKKGSVNATGKRVFDALVGRSSPSPSWPLNSAYVCALVAQPGYVRVPGGEIQEDWSRVAVSMRVSRNAGALFAQPIYFTEIHFQGDQKRSTP